MVDRTVCHQDADGDLVPGRGPRGAHRLWPYTQNWRYLVRRREEALVDPVNLVIVGATPGDVLGALLGSGWAIPSEGALQRTWIDGLPRRMAGHAALGGRERRYHLRVWSFGSGSVAAAHHELMDAEGRHRVTSWDAARDRAAADLERAGLARVGETAVITKPNLRGRASDGRAWRLRAR